MFILQLRHFSWKISWILSPRKRLIPIFSYLFSLEIFWHIFITILGFVKKSALHSPTLSSTQSLEMEAQGAGDQGEKSGSWNGGESERNGLSDRIVLRQLCSALKSYFALPFAGIRCLSDRTGLRCLWKVMAVLVSSLLAYGSTSKTERHGTDRV